MTFERPTYAKAISQHLRSRYHGLLRAKDGTITEFDAPGAGTGAGQGTFVNSISPDGLTVGFYADASGVNHGFQRSAQGKFTEIDASGAGTGAGQGTTASGSNAAGVIAGYYIDANGVSHGFVLSK